MNGKVECCCGKRGGGSARLEEKESGIVSRSGEDHVVPTKRFIVSTNPEDRFGWNSRGTGGMRGCNLPASSTYCESVLWILATLGAREKGELALVAWDVRPSVRKRPCVSMPLWMAEIWRSVSGCVWSECCPKNSGAKGTRSDRV